MRVEGAFVLWQDYIDVWPCSPNPASTLRAIAHGLRFAAHCVDVGDDRPRNVYTNCGTAVGCCMTSGIATSATEGGAAEDMTRRCSTKTANCTSEEEEMCFDGSAGCFG